MIDRRKLATLFVALAVGSSAVTLVAQEGKKAMRVPQAPSLAPAPPLGWNSFDAYCGDVTEQEVRANANYMAKHLAAYGWRYVVVDYYWYFLHPQTEDFQQQEQLDVAMDEYGRLLPAENRFPSAPGGKGFKPLADYVHSLGLKFGIHIMRGIPRAAVKKNLPILGTSAHARDVASLENTCTWSAAMYGVEAGKPAGQAYYDSIAKLYAQWGVDYIKADDMSWDNPPAREPYRAAEIEALHRAIEKSGRAMVLSLSPGPTPPAQAAHVRKNAELWRISDDFWDDWAMLKKQFEMCRPWIPWIGPDRWPDADMLPIGRIRIRGFKDGERRSRLTQDETRTLMSLWVIFRSPLMIGGDLPSMDPQTLAYLTNAEALAINQRSRNNRELFARGDQIAWAADAPEGKVKYLALFNVGDRGPKEVGVKWEEVGLKDQCVVRDVWEKKTLGVFANQFAAKLPPHAAGLFQVAPR